VLAHVLFHKSRYFKTTNIKILCGNSRKLAFAFMTGRWFWYERDS